MPNPITRFKDRFGTDYGNKLITKEYLMTVYPQIAANMITPELWVWGFNGDGSLGNNDAAILNVLTPINTFAGGANWKKISCHSTRHPAAIKTDGTLWTWGFNAYGSLGDNTTTDRLTPVTTFAGGTNWKQVSSSGYNTAAIKTDGTLWTWGYNNRGRLGDNTTTNRSTPVTTFAGGTNWRQVDVGFLVVAAIKTDGTLWTWGWDNFGQLGNNGYGVSQYTPNTTFAGGTNWKQVSSAKDHMAAVKTDGTLWTWGRNDSAQLGGNNAVSIIYTPITTFAGGTNWKQVSCGYKFTTAIKTDGTLWTWGRNYYGGLGDNTTTQRNTPVTTFAGGTNWKQVSSGYIQTAAIKTDGTLWTWGGNSSGELGDDTTIDRSTPVTTFAGGTNWKQIDCGQNYTAAIRTSDDLLGI